MENLTVNKKGLLVLAAIFCLMFILNNLTPMLNEDYFASFVWPLGTPNLGPLPENAKKISDFSDVLEYNRVYYLTEGGRLVGSFLFGVFFSFFSKVHFNAFNALLMTLLVAEIYWLAHEGTVSLYFKPSYLIWIFFSLWAFNACFVDVFLWMAGSNNYLWMMTIVLAFLIPYTKNYYNPGLLNEDKPKMTVAMFFAGVLAGWSHETTTCWLILVIFYWLYLCKKRNTLQNWKIAGFVGLCTGYALLVLAPGNYARLALQQQVNSMVTSSVYYSFKLTEFIWILLFHFFLWYFIISFLCRYKSKIGQTAVISSYVNMAKACSIIALGSGVLLFLIPASISRASFVNLTFLTIAAASIFRMTEIIKKPVFKEKEKTFLKTFGYLYLIMTVLVSLWCNFINWGHWNDILARIKKEHFSPTNKVIYVNPYFTEGRPLWWFASGFHLIYMPVVDGDEHNRINAAIAKYYGIKGIARKKPHDDKLTE